MDVSPLIDSPKLLINGASWKSQFQRRGLEKHGDVLFRKLIGGAVGLNRAIR